MERIRKWLHDKLGWGYVDKSPMSHISGDGFQPVYGCRYCDFELAQDSTGAYFHLSSRVKKQNLKSAKEKL